MRPARTSTSCPVPAEDCYRSGSSRTAPVLIALTPQRGATVVFAHLGTVPLAQRRQECQSESGRKTQCRRLEKARLHRVSDIVSQVHNQLAGWCNFVVFVGCGTIRSTSFQPCKGGDMACVRGPLGTRILVTCRLAMLTAFRVRGPAWQTACARDPTSGMTTSALSRTTGCWASLNAGPMADPLRLPQCPWQPQSHNRSNSAVVHRCIHPGYAFT